MEIVEDFALKTGIYCWSGDNIGYNTLDYQSRNSKIDPLLLWSFWWDLKLSSHLFVGGKLKFTDSLVYTVIKYIKFCKYERSRYFLSFLKFSSTEPLDWWLWDMVCSIKYPNTTKIFQMMTYG